MNTIPDNDFAQYNIVELLGLVYKEIKRRAEQQSSEPRADYFCYCGIIYKLEVDDD